MAGADHLLELALYLETYGGIGARGRDVFIDVLPDESTGIAVGAIEMRGPAPALTYGDAYIRMPRFRFEIRSTAPTSTQGDYPNIAEARNTAQVLYEACLAVCATQMPNSTGGSPTFGNWLLLLPDQEPYLAGRDDRNRVVFAFEAQGQRQNGNAVL